MWYGFEEIGLEHKTENLPLSAASAGSRRHNSFTALACMQK